MSQLSLHEVNEIEATLKTICSLIQSHNESISSAKVKKIDNDFNLSRLEQENRHIRKENKHIQSILENKTDVLTNLKEHYEGLKARENKLEERISLVQKLHEKTKGLLEAKIEENNVLRRENLEIKMDLEAEKNRLKDLKGQVLGRLSDAQGKLIEKVDLMARVKLEDMIEKTRKEVDLMEEQKALVEMEGEERVKNKEEELRAKTMEYEILRIDYQNVLASNACRRGGQGSVMNMLLEKYSNENNFKEPVDGKMEIEGKWKGTTFDQLAVKDKDKNKGNNREVDKGLKQKKPGKRQDEVLEDYGFAGAIYGGRKKNKF